MTVKKILKLVRAGSQFTDYINVLKRHDDSRDTFLIQPFLNGIRGGGNEVSAYRARKIAAEWLEYGNTAII